MRAAQARIAPLLPPTPARGYAELDGRVGSGIRVVVSGRGISRRSLGHTDRKRALREAAEPTSLRAKPATR